MMPYKLRSGLTSARKAIIQTSKLWFSAVLPYHAAKGGRDLLNTEYSRGVWDYLGNLNEVPRFSVVIGYCHFYKPTAAKILEIGCGEGLFQERLCPSRYQRFVGVDISDEAIRKASSRQDERTIFIAEDASVFQPDEKFDIIIFNESLDYFDDPLGIVRRYERFLEEKGIFIVSLFVGTDTVRAKRVWEKLESVYSPVASTRISTRPRYSWIIKVFQPA